MDIKEILKFGSISFPYKEKEEDWFGQMKIYKFEDKIIVGDYFRKEFSLKETDEAIEYFIEHTFSYDNVGMIQKILTDIKEYNGDEDEESEDMQQLKKLVKKFREEERYSEIFTRNRK